VGQVVNLRRIGNLPGVGEPLQARRKRSLPHRAGGLTIRRRLPICPTQKAPLWRFPAYTNNQNLIIFIWFNKMRIKSSILIVACLAALPAHGQTSGPFLPGAIYAVQSATRRTAQTPETGFAPGSLCDINITGLYQPFGSLSPDDKVTLRFRAPGAADAHDLTILATLPSFGGFPAQFTVLVPPESGIGQAEILAVAARGKSYSTTVWIAASDFGIFTKAAAGYDAAVAQVWRNAPLTVGLTAPVQAGEWVTLWGTGLGSTAPSAVSVEVAGIGVAPSYSGPAPGLPGVDQINFQFPDGVPGDCYVPIVVKAGGRPGNTASIAAATAPGAGGEGVCHHRLGLSPDALAKLDQGGRVRLSQSWVHSDVVSGPGASDRYSRYDTVSLEFMQYDAAGVQVITGLISMPASGCQLNLAGSAIGGVFVSAPPFDAGTPVVTGPGGVRIAMDGSFGHYSTKPSDTAYTLDAIPPSSFVPGDWSVQAPGGNDIAGFQANLRIPPALHWTNRATVSPVSRASDLILKWDATGYTDREWMQGSIGVGAGSVICQAPATAGSMAIPSSLIAQLAVMTDSGAAAGTPAVRPMVELLLTPANGNPVLYAVPLVGGGSFPGLATFSYLEMVWVDLR